jgi:hypothetical protein
MLFFLKNTEILSLDADYITFLLQLNFKMKYLIACMSFLFHLDKFGIRNGES